MSFFDFDIVEKNKKEAQELLIMLEKLSDSEKDAVYALINGFVSGVSISKESKEKESA